MRLFKVAKVGSIQIGTGATHEVLGSNAIIRFILMRIEADDD
jgi:hypothetical protein